MQQVSFIFSFDVYSVYVKNMGPKHQWAFYAFVL